MMSDDCGKLEGRGLVYVKDQSTFDASTAVLNEIESTHRLNNCAQNSITSSDFFLGAKYVRLHFHMQLTL